MCKIWFLFEFCLKMFEKILVELYNYIYNNIISKNGKKYYITNPKIERIFQYKNCNYHRYFDPSNYEKIVPNLHT